MTNDERQMTNLQENALFGAARRLCGALCVRDSRGESTFAHLGDDDTPRIARPRRLFSGAGTPKTKKPKIKDTDYRRLAQMRKKS